jgi:hypothetical protein
MLFEKIATRKSYWIPACAGMTIEKLLNSASVTPAHAGVQELRNEHD